VRRDSSSVHWAFARRAISASRSRMAFESVLLWSIAPRPRKVGEVTNPGAFARNIDDPRTLDPEAGFLKCGVNSAAVICWFVLERMHGVLRSTRHRRQHSTDLGSAPPTTAGWWGNAQLVERRGYRRYPGRPKLRHKGSEASRPHALRAVERSERSSQGEVSRARLATACRLASVSYCRATLFPRADAAAQGFSNRHARGERATL
jgi:hypothetical protein